MKQPRRTIVVSREGLESAVSAIFARVPQRSRADEAAEMVERLRANPPKQERSLETLNRLLDAAERALEEDGLDAATVPAIARRAGVSVGVVYRRFPNKEALIRAVYERFLWRVREQNGMMLQALARIDFTLPDLLRGMVRGSLESHRRKRNLIRALHQYTRASGDASLRREAEAMNRAATDALTALVLTRRAEIRHPDPESAIEFAVLVLAAAVRSIIVEKDGTHGLDVPENLEHELTRMLGAYLGIDMEPPAPKKKRVSSSLRTSKLPAADSRT